MNENGDVSDGNKASCDINSGGNGSWALLFFRLVSSAICCRILSSSLPSLTSTLVLLPPLIFHFHICFSQVSMGLCSPPPSHSFPFLLPYRNSSPRSFLIFSLNCSSINLPHLVTQSFISRYFLSSRLSYFHYIGVILSSPFSHIAILSARWFACPCIPS